MALWEFYEEAYSTTKTLKTIKTGWIKFIKEKHARWSNGESNTAKNSFSRLGFISFDPLDDTERAIENLENVNIEERLKQYVASLAKTTNLVGDR